MRFDGFLVIDKPGGMTSRDVVNRALGWFPRGTRLGHAGTLDPLATGVLIVGVGIATRLTEYVQRMSKVYRATIILGATSDTDDADGQVTPMPNVATPTREVVLAALTSFVGTINQIPPAYSAAKVAGRRSYDLARKGKEVDLAPRPVTIHSIDIESFVYPQLDVVVRCGKGTYIRSLARDLGAQLGCGGYIESLRRSQIGCFKEEDAIKLELEPVQARQHLLPLAQAVSELPRVTLDDGSAWRLVHGQHLVAPTGLDATEAAVFDASGRLLAIAEVMKGVLHAKKVVAGAEVT